MNLSWVPPVDDGSSLAPTRWHSNTHTAVGICLPGTTRSLIHNPEVSTACHLNQLFLCCFSQRGDHLRNRLSNFSS